MEGGFRDWQKWPISWRAREFLARPFRRKNGSRWFRRVARSEPQAFLTHSSPPARKGSEQMASCHREKNHRIRARARRLKGKALEAVNVHSLGRRHPDLCAHNGKNRTRRQKTVA